MATKIITLKGADSIRPAIPDIAELRMTVFRDWPYLYDGTLADEEAYLEHFSDSEHAVVGLAMHRGRVVGATTAQPFDDTHEDFRKPFLDRNIPTDRIFYFGESVLLSDYRGQGVGHAFFDLREAAAKEWQAWATAFCAVQRPDDHPSKPAHHRPLDPFWTARGYRRHDELVCRFKWKDLTEAEETPKPLVFWTRETT